MSGKALAAVLAVALASQVRLIGVEVYDPDEFEHLQAGLMFAQGSVPYRDFFEHHGPLPYLIAWLPAKVLGPTTTLLTVNRWMSLGFVAITSWAVYRLALRVAGKRAARWALVWLLTLPWFADKSLEWRPDVPAMALVTLAALAAAGRRAGLAGLLIGLATLCTPKAGALGVGVGIALMVWSAERGRTAARFGVGFAAPWVVAAAAFAAVGGLKAFLWCLFYVPAVWPMRVWVGKPLLTIALEHGPASLAVGVMAWVMAWRPVSATSPRKLAWDSVRIPVVLHWVSWAFVPAAYLQFHLLGLPLLAVGVARFLRAAMVRGATGGIRRRTSVVFVVATVGLVVGVAFELRQRWIAGALTEGEFQTVWNLIWVVLLAGFSLGRVDQRKGVRVGLVALLFLVPNGRWFFERHFILPMAAPVTRETQLGAIRDVGERVPLEARVQDGFTGVGCLHRRADYWWWVNEHSLALMERVDELKKFRARLRESPPEALIVDSGLRQALMPVREGVEREYVDVADSEALRFRLLVRRLRNGGPAPWGP